MTVNAIPDPALELARHLDQWCPDADHEDDACEYCGGTGVQPGALAAIRLVIAAAKAEGAREERARCEAECARVADEFSWRSKDAQNGALYCAGAIRSLP